MDNMYVRKPSGGGERRLKRQTCPEGVISWWSVALGLHAQSSPKEARGQATVSN